MCLARPVQRKTKCPGCGDYLFLKCRPGEPREARRVVGSTEAAEIDRAWEVYIEAQTGNFRLQRELDGARYRERMQAQVYPESLAVFHVQFFGPVRDGDLLQFTRPQDRSEWLMVLDMARGALVHRTAWTRHTVPAVCPIEALVRPFVDGSSIDCVDPASNTVARRQVAMPSLWRVDAWRLTAD